MKIVETFGELKEAIANKTPLIWNDPDPIEGTDYTITFIEDLDALVEGLDFTDEDDLRGVTILIEYDGSNAEVFLDEILIK